ncbi:hypothetical protein DPEC_G00162670 [Dallia pectoralis]|uniref:Uncharacterized protein n=1 Tax=Dallia pectoralis TaxID=75939 RepID=A0ACC2GGJ0_DALPE|nr:hypothetical protein DPEC_G00162670 [Dallia pectoralis]
MKALQRLVGLVNTEEYRLDTLWGYWEPLLHLHRGFLPGSTAERCGGLLLQRQQLHSKNRPLRPLPRSPLRVSGQGSPGESGGDVVVGLFPTWFSRSRPISQNGLGAMFRRSRDERTRKWARMRRRASAEDSGLRARSRPGSLSAVFYYVRVNRNQASHSHAYIGQ